MPGTCGDYDGDGLVGASEDNDNSTDGVFGTINGALGGANGGINQNGRVTVVTSGRFPEIVNITAANGNVTLDAAPGVEAIIDPVVQGAPGNVERQASPGIIVNAPSHRQVVIRNLTSRNWTSGIQVLEDSRVTIENVRLENNLNFGLEVRDDARVTLSQSQVHASGFRSAGPPVPTEPNPGVGVGFAGQSSGMVTFTTVTGSFDAGISDDSKESVCASHVTVFDNDPNFKSVRHGESSCEGNRPAATTSSLFEPNMNPLSLVAVAVALGVAVGRRSRRRWLPREA